MQCATVCKSAGGELITLRTEELKQQPVDSRCCNELNKEPAVACAGEREGRNKRMSILHT